MGVKSTKTLTRRDAEDKYIELMIRQQEDFFKESLLKSLTESVKQDIQSELNQYTDDAHYLREEHTTEIFVDLCYIARKADFERSVTAPRVDNETFENLLETLNDKVNGGEGFENYIIIN